EDAPYDRRHGASMEDYLRPHGHDGAIGQIESVVEIAGLGHHRRTGYRLERNRLLFGDGLEFVANDFECYGVDRLVHRLVCSADGCFGIHACTSILSITKLPAGSRRAA